MTQHPDQGLMKDSSGRLVVALDGSTDTTPPTITATTAAADGLMAGDGRKTVTTAGTAVALATTTACKWVLVTALLSNTQAVAVGASTVLAAVGSSRGAVLNAGGAVAIPVSDLASVFVDSRVNGEGVAYLYGN